MLQISWIKISGLKKGDRPRRDERQGWTRDIAVFARTDCYNLDMRRFFEKWLRGIAYALLLQDAYPSWLYTVEVGVQTSYGTIISDWHLKNRGFKIYAGIPVPTGCTWLLPNGDTHGLTICLAKGAY